jgi:hypothetical protein
VLGVHGQELPKFSLNKDSEQYWKNYKGFVPDPKVQSQIIYQQNKQYWANDDPVKISDAYYSTPAPIDPFKTEYHKQKSKFIISDKVTTINHAKLTDKVGSDPEIQKGHKPLLKWSDMEANFKCSGPDRPFRTFEKIIHNSNLWEQKESEREKLRDELKIKQAPKVLQLEVAQAIAAEKQKQEQMKIGYKSNGANTARETENNMRTDVSGRHNSSGGSGILKNDKTPVVDNKASTFEKAAMQTMVVPSSGAAAFLHTGKTSLMHRVAQSPTLNAASPAKKGMDKTMGSTMLGSTMAGTNMNNTMELTKSSPFRETCQRGMLTGMGLLKKPQFTTS